MPRVTISEPGKTPQPYRFKLERATINIGRDNDNDIVIECGSCSTNHCVMQRTEGGYILKDTQSTNGIKLDGSLMNTIDLFDGIEVLVGDVPLTFRLSDEEQHKLCDEEFISHEKKALPPIHDNVVEDVIAEEKPHPSTSSPRASHARHSRAPQEKSMDALKSLIILILMIAAIAIGMTLRHYIETGDFLPAKFIQAQ